MLRTFAPLIATLLATLGILGGHAHADAPRPSTLLVFPYWSKQPGIATLHTVSNISFNRTVRAEFVYIDGGTCLEINFIRTLAPYDTITIDSRTLPSNAGTRGYLLVRARHPETNELVSHNTLIGTALVVDGNTLEQYSYAPHSFRSPLLLPLRLDANGNGAPDLDGVELEAAPRNQHSASFLGQSPAGATGARTRTTLYAVNLTYRRPGGPWTARGIFVGRNDRGQSFQTQPSVGCWAALDLSSLSASTTQASLAAGAHDASEALDGREYGSWSWSTIQATSPNSPAWLEPPTVLLLQVERRSTHDANGPHFQKGTCATLPYVEGTTTTGTAW